MTHAESGFDVALLDGAVDFRYTGAYTPQSFGRRMERSIQMCRSLGSSRILIDLTGLADFQPSTAERYAIGCRAAQMGSELQRVAVVVSEDQLDPDLFTVTVARNRGLPIDVFTDRDEAIDWLRG